MRTTNLRKLGGSTMLTVAPTLHDALNLKAGVKVSLAADSGYLVVVPQGRSHFTLEELLSRCHPRTRRTAEGRVWAGPQPIGCELL